REHFDGRRGGEADQVPAHIRGIEQKVVLHKALLDAETLRRADDVAVQGREREIARAAGSRLHDRNTVQVDSAANPGKGIVDSHPRPGTSAADNGGADIQAVRIDIADAG